LNKLLTDNEIYILRLTMAGLQYVISGLDMLKDYPEIKEYIKNFNGAGGFMYTTEEDPQYNAEIEKQMSKILDAHGVHSGSSWGFMMRGIQSVLNGSTTRESIEEELFKFEKRYNEILREQQQLQDERAAFREETDPTDKHL
jgi:hypothetical protein